MDDTLYVLDGYSVIYRSYFAFIRTPLRNPRGENSSAIFGFLRTLISLYRDHTPRQFVVVMDSRGPTFRHERYPAYKATREKTPEDLHAQIPVIEEILEKLGVPVVRVDGFEADDLMATLAVQCRAAHRSCAVITGDKDLLQLVGDHVQVLRPGKNRLESLDREAVHQDWGVWPEQILDYLSLVGDTSDNVPGVKGIGAKGAVKLLERWGSLEEIYSNLDDVTPAGTQQKLRDHRDDAWLSRELISLVYDVPLQEGPEGYRVNSLDFDAAAPLMLDQGMSSLLGEVGVEEQSVEPLPDRPVDARLTPLTPPRERARIVLSREERELFSSPGAARLVDTLDGLRDLMDRAAAAGVVALDCETDTLDPRLARPVGFSLAMGPEEGFYLPLEGPHGRVLPQDALREALHSLVVAGQCRVVGQNFKYDWQVLHRWGVSIPAERIASDTMVAAWLVDTTAGSYGMDRLAEDYLDYRTVHFADLFPGAAKGDELSFVTVPLEAATRYAAEDAWVTWRLYHVLDRLVDLRGVRKLLEEVEIPLIPVLAAMELEGIGLDVFALESFSQELAARITQVEGEIFSLVGHQFNISSTRQLQEVLFTERKLQPVKKTKTGYSTDNSVLQELSREDPVPQKVLQYRSLTKLQSTWVESLPRMVNRRTGRVHTSLNQTGTATGRLSSTDPNLQNIPIREEEGRRIRDAFVPARGHVFVSADYRQIELVILAHLSGDPALCEAFRAGEDIHRRTAGLIFGVDSVEVSSEQRRIAKTINFGVMYGMSSFRLSNELGIPRGDAERFIQAYFGTYQGIRTFIDETVARAEGDLEVQTMLGRKRPIPEIRNRNKTVKAAAERVAVNTPIQGTGADIIKLAMLAVARRLRESDLHARLILQVHDELILECPREEESRVKALVMEAMSTAVQLSVPLGVSVESGDRWGAMHQ